MLVSPETAGNTWAPEAYYDDELGEYVVFWASKLYADNDPNHTGGHVQPDAVRHDARLPHVQRGQGLAGHRVSPASTPPCSRWATPTTASRRTRRSRPDASTSSKRHPPAHRPDHGDVEHWRVGAQKSLHRHRVPEPAASRVRRSSRPTRVTSTARATTSSSTSTAAASTSRCSRRSSGRTPLDGTRVLLAAVTGTAPRHGPARSQLRSRRACSRRTCLPAVSAGPVTVSTRTVGSRRASRDARR